MSETFSVLPSNGGRFISRGKGRHPERKITSDELIFVTNGVLDIYEEKICYQVHAGEYLLLHKGNEHGGLADYPTGLSFYWLHFYAEERLFEMIPRYGKVSRPEQLSLYCQSYLAEYQERNRDTVSLTLLLSLIFRELQKAKRLEDQKIPPLAALAHQELLLHFHEELSPRILSKRLHCNAEYLGKVYHCSYGESIMTTCHKLRTKAAARLLTGSTLSIKEIMEECAFHDPAYFRRVFSHYYGTTPGAYRKLHTKGVTITE